jgi:hypothetical protein
LVFKAVYFKYNSGQISICPLQVFRGSPILSLEQVLQSELNLSVLMHGGGDGAEGGVSEALVGYAELRVVEDVEELGVELEVL